MKYPAVALLIALGAAALVYAASSPRPASEIEKYFFRQDWFEELPRTQKAAACRFIRMLEAGDKGVVEEVEKKQMVKMLEAYHLYHINGASINLPPLSGGSGVDMPVDAERFFYVDSRGTTIIKGLADKNIPQDLSQKCLLFADRDLIYFKLKLLLSALVAEKIKFVYLAALTEEGGLTYRHFEIMAPVAFPTVYPNHVVILDNQKIYFNQSEADDLESFKKEADRVRQESISRTPFVRILADDGVLCSALMRALGLFEVSRVKPIIKLCVDDDGYEIAELRDMFMPAAEKEGK